jgi:hypothetical protein
MIMLKMPNTDCHSTTRLRLRLLVRKGNIFYDLGATHRGSTRL